MTFPRTLFRALLLALLVVSAAATAAGAAPYGPPPERRLSISVDRGGPGAQVRIGAAGFKPNSRSVVTFESTPVELATVTADANGAVATGVVIPAGASPGVHTLKVTGVDPSGQPLVALQAFEVIGTLPETGDDPQPFVLLGVVAVVAGAAILGVVALRRRRHA